MPEVRLVRAALFVLAFCAACSSAGGGANTTPVQVITPTGTPSLTALPTPTISPTSENAPDLSGEQINLPFLCGSSGPFSESNAARMAGAQDAVAAINASGGIFGAQLALRVADTQGTAEGARVAFGSVIDEFGEGPILIACDAATEFAVSELAAENEIPMLSYGLYAERGGFSFGVDASPEGHFAYFLQDLVANWAERKPDGIDNQIRVAVLGLQEDVSGTYTTQATITYAEQLGIPIVYMADLGLDEDFHVFELIYAVRDA
ncbi:MAG: ABC transporter substrate-binding protein, partial [Anaerolineales bacterium]